MQESLEASHNLPGDAQHLRVSILVRALVRGWRHTGRLRVGVDIIEALDLVAEGSRRSSSITPEAPAQPGHRERVVALESLRSCAALRLRPWLPAGPGSMLKQPAGGAGCLGTGSGRWRPPHEEE